jgi:hypothetical protein
MSEGKKVSEMVIDTGLFHNRIRSVAGRYFTADCYLDHPFVPNIVGTLAVMVKTKAVLFQYFSDYIFILRHLEVNLDGIFGVKVNFYVFNVKQIRDGKLDPLDKSVKRATVKRKSGDIFACGVPDGGFIVPTQRNMVFPHNYSC